MPIVLIGIAITVFVMYTNPFYNEIPILKTKVAAYNEALDNYKILISEREKLATKYKAIDPDNLLKLQKLLPENVDNIRLILEIEKIALPYGMVLADVKYNATTTTAEVVQGGRIAKPAHKDYGIFDLEFSTSGSYDNFISFTKDLEKNLRIVDISSISFSSDTNINSNIKTTPSLEIYKYDFKIRTYWLKN